MTEAERAQVLASIAEKFGLDAEALTTLTKEEAKRATDFYQFIPQTKRVFSLEQKVKLHMWWVAYAVGTLYKYEDHLIRKIGELSMYPTRS